MAEDTFSPFESGHQDLINSVDYDLYGERMVTASSDHTIKVWEKKEKGWEASDSWRAHDAEVLDAKWVSPMAGDFIGSIGEDGKFRLWVEDIEEPLNSSRRWKKMFDLFSKVPFMSMDFKNVDTETYLALTTWDGYLWLMEPVDQEYPQDWKFFDEADASNAEGTQGRKLLEEPPSRENETSFRISFHREKLPSWTAMVAGVDRKALSFAVAVMKDVHIYRTDKERKLYHAATLTGARDLIRDVKWAPGAMRGFDIIATASKDGYMRIYEVRTPAGEGFTSTTPFPPPQQAPARPPNASRGGRTQPSGIGASLARGQAGGSSLTTSDQDPSRPKHEVKLVAEIVPHRGRAVTRLAFSQIGDVLASTGDDGILKTWKIGIGGDWKEYAEKEGDEEEWKPQRPSKDFIRPTSKKDKAGPSTGWKWFMEKTLLDKLGSWPELFAGKGKRRKNQPRKPVVTINRDYQAPEEAPDWLLDLEVVREQQNASLSEENTLIKQLAD